jgi:hypothetical protein
MAAPRAALSATTQSVGITVKLATVLSLSADGTQAVTVDRQNIQTTVNMLVQRSKGPLPAAGDTWLLSQDLGFWSFAAFVATSAGQFSGGSSGSTAGGTSVTVSAQAPVNPQADDIWVNGSEGNAVFWWSGNAWVATQFGTQAIANGAVTAAKIASGTITSEQISPDAGITAGQVAFTVGEIGGSRVWTNTSEPQDPAVDDLWINPANGNMVSVWTGQQWEPLQFGAPAIQEGSITANQISEAAGISAAQVSFTASDIGGITTSVMAAQPADPSTNDLWFDAANDFTLMQWDGTAWVQYQFGTSALAAGSVTAALIAANTITAAQIATGTITAQQIAAGTITAASLAVGSALNANPYFAGGALTGWQAFNGTLAAVQPAGAPYQYAAQLTPNGSGSVPAIDGSAFPVVPGQFYLVSAVVNTPALAAQIGFTWENSSHGFVSTTAATITVPASTWEVISTIQQAPAGALFAYPVVGLVGTPPPTTTLQAQAVVVLTPVNGGIIEAGTITAAQIAAGTIVAGIINGTTVTGSTLQNSSSYPRTSINPNGSYTVTNSAGAVIFEIDATGTMYWYNAAGTNLQMELQPGGTILVYDSATGPVSYDFEGTAGSTDSFTAQNSGIAPSNAWSHTGLWSLLITASGTANWGATSPAFAVQGGALATAKLTIFTPAALSAVSVGLTFWSGPNGTGTDLGIVPGDAGTFAAAAAGTVTATITGAAIPALAVSATIYVQEAAADASGTLLYIDTVLVAGGLIYSNSPSGGTDAFGNAIPQGTNFHGLPGLTNVFGVEDPYGVQLAKIDAGGNFSGQLISAATDIQIAGNSVTALLADAPQGLINSGWTPVGPWPAVNIGTTETALLELDQTLQAGRSYTLQLEPFDIQGSNAGNWRAYFDIYYTTNGTTPSCGSSPSPTLVTNFPLNFPVTTQGSCWQLHPGYTIVINPTVTALYRFLVGAHASANSFQVLSSMVLTITDNGVQTNVNTMNNGVVLGSGQAGGSGGVQNWTEYFYGTRGWSYGQPAGQQANQNYYLYQGAGPGITYPFHSWIEWSTGSLGNTLNTVLNYAVQSVSLRLTNLYSNYSNGLTVSFHSGTTLGVLSSVSLELQNWAMGEGQTLDTPLTPAAWAPFMAGGVTYAVLHPPSSSTSPNYYGYFAGAEAASAQQPMLTVQYSH